MKEYQKIEWLIDEVYNLVNWLSKSEKVKAFKKAKKDNNITLQYILLDNPIQEIYDWIEMSVDAELEKED